MVPRDPGHPSWRAEFWTRELNTTGTYEIVALEHSAEEPDGAWLERAARTARGEFLLIVEEGWRPEAGALRILLQRAREAAAVMVVPRLRFADGTERTGAYRIKCDGSLGWLGELHDGRYVGLATPRQVDAPTPHCVLVERRTGLRHAQQATEYWHIAYAISAMALMLHSENQRITYVPAAVFTTSDGDAPPMAGRPRNGGGKHDATLLKERHGNELEQLDQVRLVAFYLPQFHPIPENDRWWGTGFTEWRNVTGARPLFSGHHQPHLPADLGFYDLRLPESRNAQAELAKRYGITGFCYYYYWFSGTPILERPIREVLDSGQPDFPFCICWANENWTRRWDGRDDQVLIAQQYREEDDDALIERLLPYFNDPRYIRINGHPLFLIYRIELLPDAAASIARWRRRCRDHKCPEPFIAYVESFTTAVDPREIGADAAVEFPPLMRAAEVAAPETTDPAFSGHFYDYGTSAGKFMERTLPDYPVFRGVMPSWDNTARRGSHAHVFLHATPAAYRAWLKNVIEETRHLRFGGERIVFINAWNEWAEGNHLEPDLEWGHAYLEATAHALHDGLG